MLKSFNRLLALAAALFTGYGLRADMPEGANRTAPPTVGGDRNAIVERATRRRTLAAAREAAAVRQQAALKAKGGKVDPQMLGGKNTTPGKSAALKVGGAGQLAVPGPGFQLPQPDYMFGTASNWHNTKPIHKFVDGLPGLGYENRNNLNNFIPVAKPMANPYDATSDYYEIGVVEYTQKLHSELNATKLRGYKDLNPAAENTANGGNSSNYLGPVIIANRDKAVRVKMVNQLPLTANGGDLFIPVDTTMMGAGLGPLGGTETYTQNRAEFHLHGGLNPWISDGTPHQWVTPAGEATNYKKGATFQNVPDMAAGATDGDGIGTYYWTNQQSGRFMFYHDHSFGLTRLNVYAGEAAGYLIVDPVDEKLVQAGVLPDNADLNLAPTNYYRYGIPLVIQDKTFVDTSTLGTLGVAGGTDPTWDVAKYGGDGSLWYPHVYMPNQNPADISGANAMGRWDYGAWFWPPLPLAINNNGVGLQHGAEPIPNDPAGTEIPGTPNPSLVPEAFMDTPVVNGVAYPKITVQPKAYRFRILNAANDRFWNLSFFKADPLASTEVVMVPSAPNALWPATWPTDGRAGGVPDPTTAGPSFWQIGNESGFLAAPVEIKPQPIGYNYNRRDIVVLNVQDKSLFLGPAERADVVVDFSAFAGQTLILYNDAPAPVPAFDSRLDYYTGDPDQTSTGGAAPTLAGFGPNTRTIMQVVVASGSNPAFDTTALAAAFQSTATARGAFAEAQHPPIVPQTTYNAALNKPLADLTSLTAAGIPTTPVAFANDVYVRIQDNKIRYPFPSMENGGAIQPTLEPKAIQELFELDYGRMNATLGVELPLTNFTNQTTIPLGYADPATENLIDGTTQYWKITHNGVDTHPVHFHLFDVQIVNRVGWDGAVRLPDANEIGWKETVKMNPLEDIIVAFRPLSPRLPFQLPNSSRLANVTVAEHAPISWTSSANGNPVAGTNEIQNFGWEYVWHCHILGHEENDFMRPMVLNVATTVPAGATLLTATLGLPGRADLAWTDNSTDETGFSILRSPGGAGTFTEIGTVVPNVRTFSDFTVVPGTSYDYQVVAYNQAGNGAPSNTANVNAPSTIQVSGQVSTSGGPLAGVALTFSNGGYVAITDAAGNYTASVPNGWAGVLTPALLGYTFAPANRTYGVLSTNQSAQNFTATPFATVTGQVTLNGAGLAGATVTASNGAAPATTDALGNYTLTVTTFPWSGTVTATSGTLVFTPVVSATLNLTAPGQNVVQNFAAATATVSGTVTYNAAGLAGVTMAYTGGTTTTAADGTYSFTVNAGWTGTVTPSKAGYLFTNASNTYTNLVTSTVTNYTAVAAVPISGTIYAPGVPIIPIAGVTVTFSTIGSVVTDANGNYTIDVPRGWTGTSTPSLAGWIFAPTVRNYNNVTNLQTGQNFRGTAVVVLSGNVTRNGLPWQGVTITFSNGGGTATTDAAGNYTRTLNSGWSGTVTASRNGYVFNPVNYTYANLTVNQSNLNFMVSGVNITGQVYFPGNPVSPRAGVTVSLSTGQTTTTDANGNFTLTVAPGWSGTLTYSGLGYTYTPTTRRFTNVTTPQTGMNSRTNL
jgi:FtsP/CotA-like multicopper oxidase with cupredoxin domain